MNQVDRSIYKIVVGMGAHMPIKIAGLDVSLWVDLFNGCHTKSGFGPVQFAWPDGQSYLAQDNIVVIMFNIIRGQIDKVNHE